MDGFFKSLFVDQVVINDLEVKTSTIWGLEYDDDEEPGWTERLDAAFGQRWQRLEARGWELVLELGSGGEPRWS